MIRWSEQERVVPLVSCVHHWVALGIVPRYWVSGSSTWKLIGARRTGSVVSASVVGFSSSGFRGYIFSPYLHISHFSPCTVPSLHPLLILRDGDIGHGSLNLEPLHFHCANLSLGCLIEME